MTTSEWNRLLEEFEGLNLEAATERHAATLLEIERAEWVNTEIAKRVEGGQPITRADKEAHNDPVHRQYQRDVSQHTLKAEQADRMARARWLRLSWELVARGGNPFYVGDRDHAA